MREAKAAKPLRIFDLRNNLSHLINRPPSQAPVIDGVRAIAILWVLLGHLVFFHGFIFPAQIRAVTSYWATAWIMRCDLGVDFFFVISGLLIGLILFGEFKESHDLGFARFYVRRFLRLIPVYAATMLMALYLMHRMPGFPKWGNAQNAWANILYINNFLPASKQYMGWCWSLAIEEQFYLLLPVCILLFMRFGRGRFRLLAWLMLLSVVIRYMVGHFCGTVPPLTAKPYTPYWNYFFDVEYDKLWMRFGALLAGVMGAYLTHYSMPKLKSFFAHPLPITAVSVGSLAVMTHIAFTASDSNFFNRIPYLARELWWAAHRDVFSLATIFLILGALHTPTLFGGWLRKFLSWKVFYPIAQLSYSMYLTNEMLFPRVFYKFALHFSKSIGVAGAIALDSAIGMLIVFAVSLFLYVTIERPCMLMRSHPRVLAAIAFLEKNPAAYKHGRKEKRPKIASALQ